jgi:hypothetical protein
VQLLLLAPGVPPPAGFESRVLEQLEQHRPMAEPPGEAATAGLRTTGVATATGTATGAPVARGRRRRRYRFRRPLLAAAAALVVLVGTAVVLVAGDDDDDGRIEATATTAAPEPEPAVVASAQMMNMRGMPIGTVELLDTSPTTVRLDMAGWMEAIEKWPDPPQGPWTMEIFDAAGRHESYGLPLPAEDATPDVTLDEGDELGPVHHVSVLDGTGRIWCTGSFA